MGIPVVCSNIGFGGLGIESGEGAIMRTDPGDFAQSVIGLLQSAEERQRVGLAGINVIRTKFDWDIVAKTLEGYFEEIKNPKTPNP
jgi:glycosyltransferase involved in cell wall biosynthesis